MSPDAELLQIFREETNERLDRIVATLLELEAGTAPPEAIDSLFRDAHSIKGNSGMVGFDEAQRVAHAMEDLLEDAREAGSLAPALPEALLQATDAIRRLVDGAADLAEDAIRGLRDAAARTADGGAPSAPPGNGVSTELAPSAASGNGTPMELSPSVPPGNGVPTERPPTAVDQAHPTVRSLRVDAEKVDRLVDAVGETVLHRRRLDHLVDDAARRRDQVVDDELGQGERLLDELQDAVLRLRTLPLSSIAGRYPRAVRDLAAAEGKDVHLELVGTDTQLDRVILDGISETIVHLLRNAISHGVESPEERIRAGKPATAQVELRAEPRGALVAISVADDGRGVREDLVRRGEAAGSLAEVLSEAGLSTASEVTPLAGRGVGLDAVKRHVESLGGSLEVSSQPGRGSRMTLLLPVTLALLHLLLVERGDQVFGIPLASVSEVVSVSDRLTLGGRRSIELRGEAVALVDLADVLGATAPDVSSTPLALVLGSSGSKVALVCDGVLGEQQAVVKTLGTLLSGVRGYLGGAILDDGRIALIVDPSFARRNHTSRRAAAAAQESSRPAPKILVVDDQFMVRELQRSILEAAGYRVCTAQHGAEALELLEAEQDVGLVVTDIQMPQMDGLELVRAIRDRSAVRSLPVVVVTSLGGDEDRRRGAEAGADAYIVKSDFDQESLLETVDRLVRV